MNSKCPLCNQVSVNIFHTQDYNRRISDELFQYNICEKCEIIHLINIPINLEKYYADDYYQVPSREKLIKLAKKNQHKIDLVKHYAKGNELLEIGPAVGVFACLANMNGYIVDAIEIDSTCCQLLRNGICRKVINSGDPENQLHQLGNYDVITLWHVFEHINSPFDLLEKLVNKLKPGGIILIATPNPNSIQLRFMKSYWPHLDAPRHLLLVPIKTLQKKLKMLNTELIKATYRGKDGFRWNIFSWQRLFINSVANKYLKIIAYVLGLFFGFLVSPIELFKNNSATYIAIFRKI